MDKITHQVLVVTFTSAAHVSRSGLERAMRRWQDAAADLQTLAATDLQTLAPAPCLRVEFWFS